MGGRTNAFRPGLYGTALHIRRQGTAPAFLRTGGRQSVPRGVGGLSGADAAGERGVRNAVARLVSLFSLGRLARRKAGYDRQRYSSRLAQIREGRAQQRDS